MAVIGRIDHIEDKIMEHRFKHRFKHLLVDLETTEKTVKTPVAEIDFTQATFDSLDEDEDTEELSFGGGSDDFDGDDNGDGGDDDGDGDDDEAYLQEKLAVAEDEASILSGARVIFQKDPNTGKTLMICRVDEMFVPKEFLNGKTMFKADIIFRSFREYSCPKKTIAKINSKIFKKKNWSK